MPDAAITLEGLSVQYPGVTILEDVRWDVPCGARAAILGPNGCGKSTLLRSITGYGHITCGTVTVLGQRLGHTHLHQLRRQLGIVDPRLVRLLDRQITALQLVATGFFASLTAWYDQPTDDQRQQAQQALDEVGLAGRADQPFATLSSGQQSRVWLARALVHRPRLLILDEPAADLDLLARETLLATLARLHEARPELTMVMVTHHLEELLPDTSDVLLLRRGRVVAAGPPERTLTAKHLSAAFDCPVQVHSNHGRWSWSVSPQVWSQLLEKKPRH